MPPPPFATVIETLRTALAATLPGPVAQRRMAATPPTAGWTPDDRPATARRAAALVLLYPGPLGATIPLTLRRDDLPHHPGQISLPGGAIDPGERPADAALRETEEEIGVTAGDIQLIGALSTLWIPVSNFVLAPFVGMSDRPLAFRPHTREVSSIVDVPVDWLIDRDRIRWGRRARGAGEIDFPYFDFEPHHVWGATAMVLSELACLLDPARLDE